MVDRVINYVGAVPLDVDLLNTNKNLMIGLGFALQAILGGSTVVDGLACTPTGPASQQVLVAQGSIYSTENVDGTAYGSLGSDTTHQILKQGITALGNTAFTCAAPSTSGNSIAYLIQGEYQDVDGGSTVLPYYNASNPAVAFNGPANAGTSQNTVRQGKLVLNLKAGTSATTGTQVTPTPDAGFTGLWVVTVANGITAITSGMISQYPGAPFIQYKLPQLTPGTVGRTRLTGNTTYNVATSGSDGSGDGSSGNPWQTLQHAYNDIANNVDLAGFTATIKAADGTYSSGISAAVPLVGGQLQVTGNTTTPTNCNIASTSGDCFSASGSGVGFSLAGFNLSTSGSGRNCITSAENANVFVNGNMNYGACVADHIATTGGAQVVISANYSVSGNAIVHYNTEQSEIFIQSGSTITINSSPTFSAAFANTLALGSINAVGSTYTGSATGVRYNIGMNGCIHTGGGGANYFPGNSAGTSGTQGGQYD